MDEIEALYQKFKVFALGGSTGDSFDEDDIATVIDLARDKDDFFVLDEAFIYGAVHYPDSEILNSRRVSYYHEIGDIEGRELMALAKRLNCSEEPVVQFCRAMAYNDNPQKMRLMLRQAIERYDELEDEDAIRLAALLANEGELDYALKIAPLVTKRMEYPGTYLFELAAKFAARRNWETVDELCNQLTTLEPFNKSYWSLQAEVCYYLDDLKHAVEAIEYVEAIDPKDQDSDWIRAWVLGHDPYPNEQEREERLKKAKKMLRAFLRRMPRHEGAQNAYLTLIPKLPEPVADDRTLKAMADGFFFTYTDAIPLLAAAHSTAAMSYILEKWMAYVVPDVVNYQRMRDELAEMHNEDVADMFTQMWNKMFDTHYPLHK